MVGYQWWAINGGLYVEHWELTLPILIAQLSCFFLYLSLHQDKPKYVICKQRAVGVPKL